MLTLLARRKTTKMERLIELGFATMGNHFYLTVIIVT